MATIEEEQKRTIEFFFSTLAREGATKFERLVTELDLSLEKLSPFTRFSESKYQRICLGSDATCELILICWSKGQKTAVHSHGGQQCWVHLVSGEMKETLYDTKTGMIAEKNMIIEPGTSTFLTDQIGVHSLENIHKGPSITLHLYANKIEECKVLNKETGKFETKQTKYDFHIDEL